MPSTCPTGSTSSRPRAALGDAGGTRDLRRVLDGRPALPPARARPSRAGRAPRAGERVARHRRRRRARRPRATPTSGSRRRSSATASTRSSSAGSRSRCSRRSRASAPASRTAAPNTVERLTHQLRALGQGAQPSNWDRLRELDDAGAAGRRVAATPSTSTSPSGWPAAIPQRARRGHRTARATRATSSEPDDVRSPARLLVGRVTEQIAIGRDRAHAQHAVDRDQRVAGDVGRRARRSVAEPARVRQLGQRGGERDPGRDARPTSPSSTSRPPERRPPRRRRARRARRRAAVA